MDKELIKEAVLEALQEKLGYFFVDIEKHFEHHQFIEDVMSSSKNIKSTACKTVTTTTIISTITLLLLGFLAWLKKHI